jgi:hypothetical protein
MSKQDECVSEIFRLAKEGGPDFVKRAFNEAEAYIVSRRSADRRAALIAALRAKEPLTPQMEQIIAAIERGVSPGV